MKFLIRCFCIAIFAVSMQPAAAQSYPVRPIRLIVGFSAGGATDLVARALAERMSGPLGQSVLIENRAGAGGTLGTDAVAKSPPDGYTLLFAAGAFSIAPSMFAKLPFDSVADFAPVGLVAKGAYALLAHPSVPVHSVKDLVALAKAKPGELNVAMSGVGGSPHLAGELFGSMTGIKLTFVAYKGDGPILPDLIGGHIKLAVMGISAAVPLSRSGKARVLAVTTTHRSAIAPEIPTVSESGVPGYEFTTWFGVLAPAATPKEFIAKLSAVVTKVATGADFKDRLAVLGVDAEPSSPEQFAALIKKEMDKNARIVQAAGIKPE